MSDESPDDAAGLVVPSRVVAPALPPAAGAIGILGGTFDPIHVGHLALAEEAREALGLERIVFIPAGRPPHKPDRPITSAGHRVAMVALAIADNPAFELSLVEVEREGPSYTVDTVAELVAAAANSTAPPTFTVIVSAELFGTLHTWHRPDHLLRLARLAVAPRGGYPAPNRGVLAEHFPDLDDRVDFLDAPHLDVSATEIRARAAVGRSVRYLVPVAVSDYIRDHALYSDPLWWKS